MNNANYNDMPFNDFSMINEMMLNNNLNNMNMSNQNINNYNNQNINILGSYDGYIKGNMYKDLYDQYKNYKPAKLIPNNEQAELLLNVNQTSFAAHDLRLYLDIYPNDKEKLNLFNEYQAKAMNAIKQYESKYGPILMDSPSNNNMFSWEAYSFPWEVGDK